MHCINCGRLKPVYFRSDSKFCSDECKDAYNNARKGLKRAKESVIRKILDIEKLMSAKGEIGQEAFEAMRQILAVVSLPEFDIKCGNCGQKRLYMPSPGDTCDFCQHNEWIFKPKA